MNDINRRLEQINMEYFIWIIYFIIIGLSMYANSFEKKYFLYNDYHAREKYRKLNTFIFIVAVIIYFYFVVDNYQDVKDLNFTDSPKKEELTELSFLATCLVFVSGVIFLYIIINDPDIDTEIAFS